jgi:hypothetical protein
MTLDVTMYPDGPNEERRNPENQETARKDKE